MFYPIDISFSTNLFNTFGIPRQGILLALAKVKPTTVAIKNHERTNKLYVNLPRESEVMNKTRTSKVGAISKAQKAQKSFFGKKLKFLKFFSFKKSRIVPKNVKGGPFWIY